MSEPNKKFYSQFGEDQILSEIFQCKPQGLCVEVGGFNGIDGSNSYFFEKLGWRCILIEPIPELCQEISRNRKCSIFNCAVGDYTGETKFYVYEQAPFSSSIKLTKVQLDYQKFHDETLKEITVKMETLDKLLEEENVQEKEIDFITIDVEGHEMGVFRGFSLDKYSPRIVIIEDNSLMTDSRICKFMSKFGYVLFKRTGVNDWYAKEIDSIVDQREVFKLKIKRLQAVFSLLHLKQKIRPLLPASIMSIVRKLRNEK